MGQRVRLLVQHGAQAQWHPVVTPAQRHSGQDVGILHVRDQLYQQVQQQRPHRWARQTRNWDHVSVVTINPERDHPVTRPASLFIKAA